MNKFLSGPLSALALLAFISPLGAQSFDPGVELAFMSRTMTVTLLNEGGKYVAVDLKHIAQGGSCRMDQDATIARVGPGTTGTTRVRYAAAQISSGGCPFMQAERAIVPAYALGQIQGGSRIVCVRLRTESPLPFSQRHR